MTFHGCLSVFALVFFYFKYATAEIKRRFISVQF